MPGNITFETDSHGLRPEFFEVLDSVALVLNEFKSSLITVTGHTDSTGSDEHNLILSRHRATTVAMYLENSGVLSGRIAAAGYGEKFPIASNGTVEGRAQNRRVELQIEPISE
jgi:outer membrane protein OmpA-like peptidoglycan-associated protein